MTAIDRSPATVSRRLAVAAGGLVVVLGVLSSWPSAALGGLSWLGLVLGLSRRSQRLLAVSCSGFWISAIAAALARVSVELVVVMVVLVVVVWDTGHRALEIGTTLTRTATTDRIELLHGAATIAVGTTSLLLGYGLYVVVSASESVASVLCFLLSGLVLVYVLSRQ